MLFRPADASPTLGVAVADVVQQLQKLTGKTIAVNAGSSESEHGIVLVRTDGALHPGEADRLAGKSPEAFLIRSENEESLRIVAPGDAGLAFGLYFYLHELGFRWLLPGDEWTIVPAVASTAIRVDRVVAPAFRVRTFFGTGRFGPPTPIDEKGVAQQRWTTWTSRNGFGTEFAFGGHAGEGFAVAHRAEFEKHPEYLALVGGKRMPWAKNARYCASNPDLQRLWVEDRIAALARAVAADPRSPGSFAVSVEPADGVGHCECDRCRRIGHGTEEDQTFFLANLVAKAVRKRFPGRYANLMAYGQHATPPTIAIDPNVYVTVAPEAFQRTGLSPDALVAAWRKRVPRVSLYTYWSIPDWAFDLPSFDYRNVPAAHLRSWKHAGVEGVTLETSYGAGATGIALYLASQLLWDPDQDTAPLLDEFYRLAFHDAAGPMRRMLERWAAQFTSSGYELGAAYRDLAEAREKTKDDAAVQSRVREYDIYLQYLRLWTEHLEAPKDILRIRALVVWLYRAHDTGMMGTYRMRTLLLDRFARDPALSAEFAYGNAAAVGWTAAREPIQDAELAGLMSEGARRYPPPAVEPKGYSYNLVHPEKQPPDQPEEPRPLYHVGPTDFEIEVGSNRHLEVDVTITQHRTIPFEVVSIRAEDGKTVYEERLPASGIPRKIDLKVPPGRYIGHVEDQKATFTVRAPQGVPLVTRVLMSTSLSPRVYFWVPAGLRKLAMYVPSVNPIELLDGDGHKIAAAGSGLVVADVPEGQDGRAWSFRNYKSWDSVRMINLPQVFALSPGALIVPEDAAGVR
jgi:hypothetical protein